MHVDIAPALFRISELTHTARDNDEFYRELHHIVSGLMFAENLFVAVRAPHTGHIRFEYWSDAIAKELTRGGLNEESQEQLRSTLTAHVIRTGTLVHLPGEDAEAYFDEQGLTLFGVHAEDWLGVPLVGPAGAFGALVVQSYDPAIRYTDADVRLLEFVCQHVATAVQRKWADEALRRSYEELEQRVALRTEELTRANLELMRETERRSQGERTQSALYRIAQLASEDLETDEFFTRVHEVVADLVYAKNLFIALMDREAGMLRYPYIADQHHDTWHDDLVPTDPSVPTGPTVAVFRSGEPRLYTRGSLPEKYWGADPVAWLGVPLKAGGLCIGVMALQSYDRDVDYNDNDLLLLTFVARQLATSIQRRADKLALQKINDELEHRVEQRTRELVESAKLAALGSMVAGVAHEINTPVGVAVTAASHIKTLCAKSKDPETQARSGEACELLMANLHRAKELINSFKGVAADQCSGDHRRFNLHEYLGQTLVSLRPEVSKRGHQMRFECPEDAEMDGFPGALYQIASNLVMNSLLHGFEDGQSGLLDIRVTPHQDGYELVYKDNGRGMDEEQRRKLFEPFFTTRRSQGSTGLGMHLVYNSVSRVGGRIHVDSEVGCGVTFTIWLPSGLNEE